MKLNKAAAALGKKGGKAGTGKAKARTSEQARRAANTRWRLRDLEIQNEKLREALVRRHGEQSYAMPKYVIEALGLPNNAICSTELSHNTQKPA